MYAIPGDRKSWRAAGGHLQVLLKVAFYDTLQHDEPLTLSQDQLSKFSKVSGLLVRRIKSTGGRDIESVLENQIDHFRTIAQALSEHMCWTHMLDELFCREDFTPATRETQATFLNEKVNQVRERLHEITEEAKISAQTE